MKVMVIHTGDARGVELAQRLAALGCEVTEQQAVWPGFFQAVHQSHTPGSLHRDPKEQPEVVVVEGASDPSTGRECAGYLGETAFTRHIPVYLVDHPEDQAYRARRRAPRATLVTRGQLEQLISEKIGPKDREASGQTA